MTSKKPVKKAEREDPVIKKTVTTEYIPAINDLVVREFGYSNESTMEESWRKNYHTSDKIDRFLIKFSEKFIRELYTQNPFFKNPKTLKPLMRNIAEYLSVYFVRTGRFENRGDAKNYIRTALSENSMDIKKILNGTPPPAVKVKPVKKNKFHQGAKSMEKIVRMDINSVFKEAQDIRNTAAAERRRRMGKS